MGESARLDWLVCPQNTRKRERLNVDQWSKRYTARLASRSCGAERRYTCRGSRLRSTNALAVTDADLLTQSVEGSLQLLSSASRLLLPAEDIEGALPVLAQLLVPAWVDGCRIGLAGDEDEVRIAASVGERESGWTLEIPIRGRGPARYGSMWLAGSGEGPSSLIRSLADELALRIAIGIDTAQAIAREHHVAETLQRALLPEILPSNPSAVLDADAGGGRVDRGRRLV